VIWTQVRWAIVTVIIVAGIVQATDLRFVSVKNAAAVAKDTELSRYEAIHMLRMHELRTGLVQKVTSLLIRISADSQVFQIQNMELRTAQSRENLLWR
jgi:hypothetical protein